MTGGAEKERRKLDVRRNAREVSAYKRLVAGRRKTTREATRQRHRKGDLLSRWCGARRRRSTASASCITTTGRGAVV